MHNQLWAPWRIKYILKEKEEGCIFCKKIAENKDEKNYILHRSEHCFMILNIFPYNNGHLMVVPYRHIAELSAMEKEELNEMITLVARGTEALKGAMNPDGFNVGANIGEIAGAGISDHLHTHVVPRWKADTNFMPVLSDTDIIPESLEDTYKKIKTALGDLK